MNKIRTENQKGEQRRNSDPDALTLASELHRNPIYKELTSLTRTKMSIRPDLLNSCPSLLGCRAVSESGIDDVYGFTRSQIAHEIIINCITGIVPDRDRQIGEAALAIGQWDGKTIAARLRGLAIAGISSESYKARRREVFKTLLETLESPEAALYPKNRPKRLIRIEGRSLEKSPILEQIHVAASVMMALALDLHFNAIAYQFVRHLDYSWAEDTVGWQVEGDDSVVLPITYSTTRDQMGYELLARYIAFSAAARDFRVDLNIWGRAIFPNGQIQALYFMLNTMEACSVLTQMDMSRLRDAYREAGTNEPAGFLDYLREHPERAARIDLVDKWDSWLQGMNDRTFMSPLHELMLVIAKSAAIVGILGRYIEPDSAVVFEERLQAFLSVEQYYRNNYDLWHGEWEWTQQFGRPDDVITKVLNTSDRLASHELAMIESRLHYTKHEAEWTVGSALLEQVDRRLFDDSIET